MSKEIEITVCYVEASEQSKERVRYYMDKFWNAIFDKYFEDPEAFHKKYTALGYKLE